MTSFQLSLTPHRRAAARFVDSVHRRLKKAYADRPEVSQTQIAEQLGVHRSVISRQLRGRENMTLSRVAELAWTLGYEPNFDLVDVDEFAKSCNEPAPAHLKANLHVNVVSSDSQEDWEMAYVNPASAPNAKKIEWVSR